MSFALRPVLKEYLKFTDRGFKTCTQCYSNENVKEKFKDSIMKLPVPSFLKIFASRDPKPFPTFHRYNPFTFTMKDFNHAKHKFLREAEIARQAFSEERLTMLGPDLAAAHFIVFRGGKVKFRGIKEWVTQYENEDGDQTLPTRFDRDYIVEAIDASGSELIHEGIINIGKLPKLRSFSVAGCPQVDDWFIDKLSGEIGATLYHLDLSDCPNLTENFLSCMYRFKQLKTLTIRNVATTTSFQLGCLLLEEAFPRLTVHGIEVSCTNSD